jgi:hypothetical protein
MRRGDPLFSGIFCDEIDVAVCDLDDGIALDFKRRERLELELRTAPGQLATILGAGDTCALGSGQ